MFMTPKRISLFTFIAIEILRSENRLDHLSLIIKQKEINKFLVSEVITYHSVHLKNKRILYIVHVISFTKDPQLLCTSINF